MSSLGHPYQCPKCGTFNHTVIKGKPHLTADKDCVISNSVTFVMACDTCNSTWKSRFYFSDHSCFCEKPNIISRKVQNNATSIHI